MKIRIPTILMMVTSVAVLLLSGCQSPKPAALSNDQVIQVVDQTLKAIDARNYQDFTVDFSDEMKTAFPESQLTSLADLLQNSSGEYISCAGSTPELSNNQGYAVYRVICKYELENVIVTMTFKEDGEKVEGLFFDSTNLRKANQ